MSGFSLLAVNFIQTLGFSKYNNMFGKMCLHWGLNPGPSLYKRDALPLRHRGKEQFLVVRLTANL